MEDFIECVHDMIDEIRDKLDDIELNYPTIPELEDFINSYLRWYND